MTVRSLGILAAGVSAWAVYSASVQAQGVLPPTGLDTRVGDLRGHFEKAFGPLAEPTTQQWTFTPSLDVSEAYDNGVAVGGRSGTLRLGTDLITRITPGIAVSGVSSRLTGNLFYSPTVSIFAFHPNQSGLSHNLDAAAMLTVIPDLMFIDFRGYAAEQSLSGGQSYGTVTPNSQDAVQTTSFSIAPTIRKRFDGTGTAEIGGSLSRTSFSSEANVPALTGLSAGGLNSVQYTQEEHASFVTGENFGRINDALTASALQSHSVGVRRNSERWNISNEVGYALFRSLVITGSLGYENIEYSGVTSLRIKGVTWSGGFKWSPNPDSNLTVTYGRNQGFTSFSVDGTYAPTARTRVFARYSHGVGTSLDTLQNAVNTSTVGPSGIPVDARTGIPVSLSSNFFGTQPGLYRTTTASLSGVLLLDRDTITLTLEHDERTAVGTTSPALAPSVGNATGSGTTGSVTWTRQFTEDLSGTAFTQYGVQQQQTTVTTGAVRDQNIFTINLSLTYALSKTLGLSGEFTHTNAAYGLATSNRPRDIAIVSVHKTF
jgi:uncharacterized protein (PEP-CTERM system associated)